MKVKCLYTCNAEIPVLPVLIEKYGYFPSTILHLTRGREYTVYGMTYCAEGVLTFPTLSYIIRNDLGSITSCAALLFEVTDSRLTDVEWHVDFFKEVNGFRLLPGKSANDLEEFEKTEGSDGSDRSLYDICCDRIDRIEAERTCPED